MTKQRGVHLVLDEATAEELLALAGDDEAVTRYLQAEVDDYSRQGASYEPVYETGRLWWLIQSCLASGAGEVEGELALRLAVVGGRQLCRGGEPIASYKTPGEVLEVARALEWLTEEELRERYEALDRAAAPPVVSQDELDLLIHRSLGLIDFYHFAASQGLAVVFTTAIVESAPGSGGEV